MVFDPPLPAAKQEAIQRLGYGRLNKVSACGGRGGRGGAVQGWLEKQYRMHWKLQTKSLPNERPSGRPGATCVCVGVRVHVRLLKRTARAA